MGLPARPRSVSQRGSPRDTKSRSGSGLLQYFGCGRQSEVESRAPSGIGRGPQTATMRLNNGTADRQAHARALWFGRKERIENLARLLGRQTYAGVAN